MEVFTEMTIWSWVLKNEEEFAILSSRKIPSPRKCMSKSPPSMIMHGVFRKQGIGGLKHRVHGTRVGRWSRKVG